MKKQHGPRPAPWSPKPPATVECPDCGGAGSFPGVTMPIICMKCDGFGRQHSSGRDLTRDEREAVLKFDLADAQLQLALAERELALLEPYRKAAADARIAKMAYPEHYKRNRRGGHGD